MIKNILILTVIALFLMSGCVKEKIIEKPAGCEFPRIMYDGECCLDLDSSGTCDMIEEAIKRAEQIKEEKAKEKIPDQCTEMSKWVTCNDLDISYDKIIQRGLIKIQLQNNRDGILVIKKFKFPELPACNKELSWDRDQTGMLPGESNKYIIECNLLANKDILDTTIEMDINFYERVAGLEPHLPAQYSAEVEQTIKGKIKGST